MRQLFLSVETPFLSDIIRFVINADVRYLHTRTVSVMPTDAKHFLSGADTITASMLQNQ